MGVQFSPIASGETLRQLKELQLLQPHVVVEALDVLENPLSYQWLNAWTLAEPVVNCSGLKSIADIVHAATIVNAEWIVLPDFPHDGIETLRSFRQGQQRLGALFKTIGVVQGTTSIEAMMCAIALREAGCDGLALPKNLVSNSEIGSRLYIARRIEEYMTKDIGESYPLFLFGASDNMVDDLKTAMCSGVVGWCSAQPIWIGRDFTLTHKPLDFWQTHDVTVGVIVQLNRIRRHLNGSDD